MRKFRIQLRYKNVHVDHLDLHQNRFQAIGNPCPYCWRPMTATNGPYTSGTNATLDHFVPKSRGGTNDPGNLVVVCSDCNFNKSDRLLLEWLGVLKARNDRRAEIVAEFLDYIVCGWAQEEQAAVWAAVGAALVEERSKLIPQSRKSNVIDVEVVDIGGRQHLRRVSEHQKIRNAIHDVMLELGIPRTHWALYENSELRVLVCSNVRRFTYSTPELLRSQIEWVRETMALKRSLTK